MRELVFFGCGLGISFLGPLLLRLDLAFLFYLSVYLCGVFSTLSVLYLLARSKYSHLLHKLVPPPPTPEPKPAQVQPVQPVQPVQQPVQAGVQVVQSLPSISTSSSVQSIDPENPRRPVRAGTTPKSPTSRSSSDRKRDTQETLLRKDKKEREKDKERASEKEKEKEKGGEKEKNEKEKEKGESIEKEYPYVKERERSEKERPERNSERGRASEKDKPRLKETLSKSQSTLAPAIPGSFDSESEKKSNRKTESTDEEASSEYEALQAPRISVSPAEYTVLLADWLEIRYDTKVKEIWSKRYFVLKSIGWLSIYENEQATHEKCYAHIHLLNCEVIEKKSKKSNKFKFQLTDKKKHIFRSHIPGEPPVTGWASVYRSLSTRVILRTSNEDKRNRWVGEIRHLITKLNPSRSASLITSSSATTPMIPPTLLASYEVATATVPGLPSTPRKDGREPKEVTIHPSVKLEKKETPISNLATHPRFYHKRSRSVGVKMEDMKEVVQVVPPPVVTMEMEEKRSSEGKEKVKEREGSDRDRGGREKDKARDKEREKEKDSGDVSASSEEDDDDVIDDQLLMSVRDDLSDEEHSKRRKEADKTMAKGVGEIFTTTKQDEALSPSPSTALSTAPSSTASSSSSSSSQTSFFSLLRSGLDLTRISIPIHYFEPTTFLQRLCETSQYYQLLQRAGKYDNTIQQLTYVALYAISYQSCNTRITKPFNPYLGETYEFVDEQENYKFLAEQVSHHPPIGVMVGESDLFRIWRYQGVKTRFGANNLDVTPTGKTFVLMKNTKCLYSWNFISAKVYNVMIGKMWVDQFGEMEIVNHTNGEKASLDFLATGYFGKNQYETRASVQDVNGKTRVKLSGKWNDSITLVDGGGMTWDVSEGSVLWKHTSLYNKKDNSDPKKKILSKYELSPFVFKMNELSDRDQETLPKTDSRFRPDRAALERGDSELADRLKRQLEDEQRERRKRMETTGEQWVPRYFKKVSDTVGGDGGEENGWEYKGSYWEDRQKRIDEYSNTHS